MPAGNVHCPHYSSVLACTMAASVQQRIAVSRAAVERFFKEIENAGVNRCNLQ
jgi:hypothetical protein